MSNSLLTIDVITREAVKLFRSSNLFLRDMDLQYDGLFTPEAPHVWVPKLDIPLPAAVALGAAAAIMKNPTVSRRFWSGWLQ